MDISSDTNPKVKWLRGIFEKKKERQQEGVFVAEGVRLLEEAVRHNYCPLAVFHSDELSPRANQLVESLQEMTSEMYQLPARLFQRIVDTETSQGIVGVFEMSSQFPENPDFILVLDQVRDPGNAGTLLRTAQAMGVDAIIVTPGTVDLYSPKVVRAAMGVHFSLPMVEMDWNTINSALRKDRSNPVSIVCTVVDGGTPIWQLKPEFPLALVVGNEAHGVSQEGLSLADERIAIPMPGEVESLNAAIAGSIAMYEIMRLSQL